MFDVNLTDSFFQILINNSFTAVRIGSTTKNEDRFIFCLEKYTWTKRRFCQQVFTGVVRMPNNVINSDSDKRRAFVAPLITAGYGERWTPEEQ